MPCEGGPISSGDEECDRKSGSQGKAIDFDRSAAQRPDCQLTWRLRSPGNGTIGPMEISQQIATALGFPKPAFTSVEHERRWLCREVPRERILHSEAITDLYVTGHEAAAGGRLARSAADGQSCNSAARPTSTRGHASITSIYLPEEEFAVLAASLPGVRIKKLRHRLQSPPHVALHVDEFQGVLGGLIMVEADQSVAPPPASNRRRQSRMNNGTTLFRPQPASPIPACARSISWRTAGRPGSTSRPPSPTPRPSSASFPPRPRRRLLQMRSSS